ncbi:unnamed protein product, partial [Urochloa humidicola]
AKPTGHEQKLAKTREPYLQHCAAAHRRCLPSAAPPTAVSPLGGTARVVLLTQTPVPRAHAVLPLSPLPAASHPNNATRAVQIISTPSLQHSKPPDRARPPLQLRFEARMKVLRGWRFFEVYSFSCCHFSCPKLSHH